MKKVTILMIFVLFCLSLSSCYQDKSYNSLNDYITRVENTGYGYSSSEIDSAENFLPSRTFVSDFEYESGGYHYYEEDAFRELLDGRRNPEISILWLKYEEATYQEAKTFMLANIPLSNNNLYNYNSYVFYKNSIFTEFQEELIVPSCFTMACYNDENQTLIFIGFEYSYISNEDKEFLKSLETWEKFIDAYYSEYYDFGK